MDQSSFQKDLKGSKSCADLPRDPSSHRGISPGSSHRSTSASASIPLIPSSPSSSSTIIVNTNSVSQSTTTTTTTPFLPLSPSKNLVPRSRNVSGQQNVSYPNPMAPINFNATDPSEWTLARVLNWLEYNKFGPDWIETFRTRNIHGSEFLSLVSYTRLKKDIGKDLGLLSTSNDIYCTSPSRFIQILRKVLDKSSSSTSQNSLNAARESGIWPKDESDIDNISHTFDGYHSGSICPEHPVYINPSKISPSQSHHTPSNTSTATAPANTQNTHDRHATTAYNSSSIPATSNASKNVTNGYPSPSLSPVSPGIFRLPVQKHGSYDNLKEIDPTQVYVRSRPKNKSDPQILNPNEPSFQNPHSNQLRAPSATENTSSNQGSLAIAASSFSTQKHQVYSCFSVRLSQNFFFLPFVNCKLLLTFSF